MRTPQPNQGGRHAAGVSQRRRFSFLRRVLIVAAVGALALLLWFVVDILLVFGAVLVAVLLRALAEPIARRTPLSDGWALVAVTLALLVAVGLAAALFGAEVRAQIAELADRLPESWEAFQERIGGTEFGERLVSRAEDAAPDPDSVVSRLASMFTSFVGGVASFLLIMVGGLYLAAQPDLYRQGVLLLFPGAGARERWRKRSTQPAPRCASGCSANWSRWASCSC